MQAWEEKIIERQEAKEEGKKEGRNEKLMEQIQKKLSRGDSVSKIAEELMEEETTIYEVIDKMKKEEKLSEVVSVSSNLAKG